MFINFKAQASLPAFAGCLLLSPALTFAQAAEPSGQTTAEEGLGEIEEIIVQARRRDETALSIPVAVTALGAADIARSGATDLPDIARLVPQLIISNTGNAQGAFVAFRGIASATESNNLSDQSLSFNVDGAQVSRASISRLGQLDLAQIEILKGPQALFYGKNSPAGIVSLRSADPTDSVYISGSASYEIEAREMRGEAVVSGPITETLGARLAVAASDTDGWIKNDAPSSAAFPPADDRMPHGKEYMGRLTLKFQPNDIFDAKLKLAYSDLDTSSALLQPIYCPNGAYQLGDAGENCKLDDHLIKGDLGPNLRNVHRGYGDGSPYMRMEQSVDSLEMNIAVTDTLKLTSLTTYYEVDNEFVDNFAPTAVPNRELANYGQFAVTERAQELRLLSNFGGMFDFLTGGYFQDGDARNGAVPALNALNPFVLSNFDYQVKYKTYSGFAQLMYRPISTVELSAGGRYTEEKKDLDIYQFTTGAPVATLVTDRKFDDWSPEVSATWRPTDRMTFYGNYKEGFLSGGFNAGTGSPAGDRSYEPQRIHGQEIGFKGLFLDDTVRLNVQAFNYVVTGLQITSIGQNLVQTVSNAGRSKSRGIEADVNWKTPLEGLRLHAATAYNHARYDIFNAPCMRGQSISQGCSLNQLASGAFSAQNLSDEQVLRSPDWAGSVGAIFGRPLGAVWAFELSGDMTFSSGYYGDATNNPFSRQDSYQLYNLTARFHDQSDKWEFAVIGRNLTDEYYYTTTAEVVGTGSGGGTINPGVYADVSGVAARGREVVFRVGYKFE